MSIDNADAASSNVAAGTAEECRLSELLARLASDEKRERIAISDLLAALEDRAIAALLFIFAFPNVLPAPPGLSAILGAPLIFLAAQLALGRRPWLPGVIANRSMARKDFHAVVVRVQPWLARSEALLKPRLSFLSTMPMERLVGLVCFVLAVVLFLPIPFGNMLPALAICIMALGVLEKDGVWIAAGLLFSVLSAGLVWGVIYALVKTGLYMLSQII